MQRQVRGEAVPLIHEAAAKKVWSPVTSSDVEEERLELYCRVVREAVAADATEKTRGGHAAVYSCSGEVNGGAGKAGPTLPPHMRSGQSEAGQQWVQDDGLQEPELGWMEEGEQPCWMELAPESPAPEALVEQWETLHVRDGVFQKGVEDAATQHTCLLVNPFSLQAERLEKVHVDVSDGHLERRKTLYRICR